MTRTWTEYDIYEINLAGGEQLYEPYTGTFQSLEEARRELRAIRQQSPAKNVVIVKSSFEVLPDAVCEKIKE